MDQKIIDQLMIFFRLIIVNSSAIEDYHFLNLKSLKEGVANDFKI